MNNEPMSLKEALDYLLERNYDWESLVQYTSTEVRILAQDQKARENGRSN